MVMMVICLEPGANDLHVVQLMPCTASPSSRTSLKSRTVCTSLVPAYPGCSGKEAVKRVSVVRAYNFRTTTASVVVVNSHNVTASDGVGR